MSAAERNQRHTDSSKTLLYDSQEKVACSELENTFWEGKVDGVTIKTRPQCVHKMRWTDSDFIPLKANSNHRTSAFSKYTVICRVPQYTAIETYTLQSSQRHTAIESSPVLYHRHTAVVYKSLHKYGVHFQNHRCSP